MKKTKTNKIFNFLEDRKMRQEKFFGQEKKKEKSILGGWNYSEMVNI